MESKRYPHYLSKIGNGSWPERIICVDCVSERVETADETRHVGETLRSWHAVCLTRKDDAYGIVRVVTSPKASVWWDMLQGELQREGNLWVMSYRCPRIWSLLQLWEGLENGRLRLSGSDGTKADRYAAAVLAVRRTQRDPLGPVSSGAVSRMLGQGDGYLVIEDPPCIAALSLPPSPGKLTWVDLRNYGASPTEDTASGVPIAVWMGRWVQRVGDALKKYKLGALKATAGSQAMSAFKGEYHASGVYVHNEHGALGAESASYSGGRCECRWIGSVRPSLWHFDLRSAYAWYYSQAKLPTRLHSYREDRTGKGKPADLDPSCSIARVAIVTDEPAYPYRRQPADCAASDPLGERSQGRLTGAGTDVIYPTGRYYTWLCGPELEDALAKGRVDHWTHCVTYEMEACLERYGKALYALRVEADSQDDRDMSSFAKKLLVSIVGKFGQRSRRWVPSEVSCDIQYGEWIGGGGPGASPIRYRAIAGHVQRDDLGGFSYDALPAIAGWITSGARLRLLRCIRAAGWSHVYYVDTDALLVCSAGASMLAGAGLIKEGVWGYLQDKGGPYKAELRGIKHYVLNDKVTCAGLPKGTAIDAGDGSHYWYSSAPTSQILAGQRPQAEARLMTYQSRAPYRHGVVGEDGKVTPIELKEW